MGAHQDLVQGAVVLRLAVVCALVDSTLDRLVCIAVHNRFLLLIGYGSIMNCTVAFYSGVWYSIFRLYKNEGV